MEDGKLKSKLTEKIGDWRSQIGDWMFLVQAQQESGRNKSKIVNLKSEKLHLL
jgi:hypothetical protein